jgi:hypothetical protein
VNVDFIYYMFIHYIFILIVIPKLYTNFMAFCNLLGDYVFLFRALLFRERENITNAFCCTLN